MRGVVHRDVSPHNVLVSWEGAVKVSDFGIAKAREASEATASTMIKGKPGYMSPEQANGEALDGRSDLFAIGVMAWETLTGRRLFDGTTKEMIAQVLFKPIPIPSAMRPDVPKDLEAVVMRLLEREKAKRYENAEAAIDELARCTHSPRNGRSELTRLLADRFPAAVASRASRPPEASGSNATATAATELAKHPNAWQPTPTTLGSATGQSVVSQSSPVRRRWAVAAASAAASIAIAVTVIFVGTRGSDGPAASPARPDAAIAPTTATLTITSVPEGAEIRVDGVGRGSAPVRIEIASGTRVSVSARREGFQSISQTVYMAAANQTLALALVAAPTVIDAGVAEATIDAPVPTTEKPIKPTKPTKPAKPTTTNGSTTTPFNPNEVGGD
ncbi:MAG: serine/threonine protein kinase [Deltaproteobacteria bacterium]|nr:serine/threonine protein kinase [Deltaproteobacteria bacterium]